MKQYKGNLTPETKALISQHKDRLERLLSGRLGKVSSNNLVYTLEESIEKYNAGLTQEEIKAWVWYRRKMGIPMTNWKAYFTNPSENDLKKWVSNGILFYDNGNLVPFAIFVFGNIYPKITSLKKNQTEIVTNFGQSVYDNHLAVLNEAKPDALSVLNPDPIGRPVIIPMGDISKNFIVTTVDNLEVPENTTLLQAFLSWLREQDSSFFPKVSRWEIESYYFQNANKSKNADQEDHDKKVGLCREYAQRYFTDFLHKNLGYNDQLRLDIFYNENYNGIADIKVHKVPVSMQTSKLFKNQDLILSDVQKEGSAFMELTGSGIIAYDVGVGKTITAIVSLINAINSGKCSRALVVVPKATYKNWLLEVAGNDVLEGIASGTGIVINDFFNFSETKNFKKSMLDKKVPERSITIITYYAFEKLGFNTETANGHFEALASIFNQDGRTSRDTEKALEKLREKVGAGNRATLVDIETLGFDAICIDEAHNFKNIFGNIKSNKDDAKFEIKGSSSSRGIKAFFMCNYIQRTYNGNVMLLTATPFNNQPVEIYNMLSLVALDYMTENKILDIHCFFQQFVKLEYDYVAEKDGTIQYAEVIKGWSNIMALRQLVSSHINVKSGEDANVKRPCKINFPKTTTVNKNGLVEKIAKSEQVLTYLEQNELQKNNQFEINELLKEKVSKDDIQEGKIISLMTENRSNALSPFLVGKSGNSFVSHLAVEPLDYIDFVENSPKILYTMKCIQTIRKYHEAKNESLSNQIIYSARGIQYFPLIKEYLEKQCGYKQKVTFENKKVDEVCIVAGQINDDEKEDIVTAFNAGIVKIIIGSDMIKEGLNLQIKSTVLFNLFVDWNPTGIRQLEGRIWRQKNTFQYVRIVLPLVENSMDVFMFQKLEEKSKRINELFSKVKDGKNFLDEESLDPNEVKFALITDLNTLLEFELMIIATKLEDDKRFIANKITELESYSEIKTVVENGRINYYKQVTNTLQNFANYKLFYQKSTGDSFYFANIVTTDLEKDLTKDEQNKVRLYQNLFNFLSEVAISYDDKRLISAISRIKATLDNSPNDWYLDNFKKNVSKFAKLNKEAFEQTGSTSTNIQVVIDNLINDVAKIDAELESLKSDEYQRTVYNRIAEQKKKYAVDAADIDSRVNSFAKTNYLMSYVFDPNSLECDIPNTGAKPIEEPKTIDKEKRIRIANANARAKIKILELLAA